MELLFALSFLAIAGMAYFFVKQKELKRQLSSKQHEIDQLRMEIEVIRLQLNPHFLNNLFNFLSYKTSVGNSEEVAESIHLIGNYIRSIHRISKRKSHSLELELDWAEEYLKLYEMLSLGTISHEIKIDSAAEIELIEVPTCFLSSIIDFFIVHRFHNGSRSGKLLISVTFFNGEVVINLVDNIDSEFSEQESLAKQIIDFLIRRISLILSEQNPDNFFKLELNNGISIRFRTHKHV